MSDETIVNEADNEHEKDSGDGFADSLAAVSLILLAVCFCIYLVSNQ